MTTPKPRVRPRISGRDILPILLSGLIVAGAILLSKLIAVADIIGALAMGVGFMLALAGMQGRADALTPRSAFVAWIKLSVISCVVLLATGQLMLPGKVLRLLVFLGASLGASLLLFVLRTRRA
jgi:hypothetical protein